MSYTHYYPNSSLFHCSLDNIMGTRLDLVMVGNDLNHLSSVWTSIERRLTELDLLMSRFDGRAELHRLNLSAASQDFCPSPALWNLLEDAFHYRRLTSGLFDITLGRSGSVVLDRAQRTLHFLHPDIYLDLGGYGKGYALREVKSLLQQEGIADAFVNFGNSSILATGRHPYGEAWSVSVSHPFTGERLDTFLLKDSALSVSGNSPAHPQHIYHPFHHRCKAAHLLIAVETADPLVGEVLSTAGFLTEGPEAFEELISPFTIKDKQYIQL